MDTHSCGVRVGNARLLLTAVQRLAHLVSTRQSILTLPTFFIALFLRIRCHQMSPVLCPSCAGATATLSDNPATPDYSIALSFTSLCAQSCILINSLEPFLQTSCDRILVPDSDVFRYFTITKVAIKSVLNMVLKRLLKK